MKTPPRLLIAAALAAAAPARASTAPGAGFSNLDASTLEAASPASADAPPAGGQTCYDMAAQKQFIFFHGTVKMSDLATGKNTDFISLDKTDDPVVRAYGQCLRSQRPFGFSARLGARPDVAAGLGTPGGLMTPGGSTFKADGSPAAGGGGDSVGAGPLASGAGAVPEPSGSGMLGLSGTSGSDPSTVGASDSGARSLGSGMGRLMAQLGGAPGLGAGPGARGAAALEPGRVDGATVADTSKIRLTYRPAIAADARMKGVEGSVLNANALGSPSATDPNAGQPQPLGLRATTNQ